MKHQYSITVGNLGTVWDGTNGAAANVQYGQWVAQSRELTGRASGEPVTLFRDGEPVYEFNPGPFWFVELTDTFSGEANYSWVNRIKVQAKTRAQAVRRFSRDAGFTGRVCFDHDIPDELGTARYNVKGAALCFFVCAWDDDYHGQLTFVKGL